MLDDRAFASLTSLLLLFNLLSLLALGAHVCIVTIELAVKAHHTFILRVVLLVFAQELIQLIGVTRFLLAVGRLVSYDSTVVTAYSHLAALGLDRVPPLRIIFLVATTIATPTLLLL